MEAPHLSSKTWPQWPLTSALAAHVARSFSPPLDLQPTSSLKQWEPTLCEVSWRFPDVTVPSFRAYTSYNNHPSYRQNYGRDFRLYFAQTGTIAEWTWLSAKCRLAYWWQPRGPHRLHPQRWPVPGVPLHHPLRLDVLQRPARGLVPRQHTRPPVHHTLTSYTPCGSQTNRNT